MDRRRGKGINIFLQFRKETYTSKIIRNIEKQDGMSVTEQDDIVKETKCVYKHLYKQEEQINDVDFEEIIREQESIPKLTEEQCNSLEGKISKDEVLSTLKRMKKWYKPRFRRVYCWFKKKKKKKNQERYWHSIRSCNKPINKSFRTESLNSPQKEGLITLLPKGDKPRQFLKWKPITLLNVSYKIASGCIANRIKRVLPNIIHSDQTGFINLIPIGFSLRLTGFFQGTPVFPFIPRDVWK